MKYSQKIVFTKLTFTAPGKYLYTIKELTPSSGAWESDKRIYRIVITVSEDEDGKLIASVDYPDGLPKFVNKYHPCPKPILPCKLCKCFDKLPFPMIWFFPPQLPEFMELLEKSPEVFEKDWWERFFKNTCDN